MKYNFKNYSKLRLKNVSLGPCGIWTQDLWYGSWHIILLHPAANKTLRPLARCLKDVHFSREHIAIFSVNCFIAFKTVMKISFCNAITNLFSQIFWPKLYLHEYDLFQSLIIAYLWKKNFLKNKWHCIKNNLSNSCHKLK